MATPPAPPGEGNKPFPGGWGGEPGVDGPGVKGSGMVVVGVGGGGPRLRGLTGAGAVQVRLLALIHSRFTSCLVESPGLGLLERSAGAPRRGYMQAGRAVWSRCCGASCHGWPAHGQLRLVLHQQAVPGLLEAARITGGVR